MGQECYFYAIGYICQLDEARRNTADKGAGLGLATGNWPLRVTVLHWSCACSEYKVVTSGFLLDFEFLVHDLHGYMQRRRSYSSVGNALLFLTFVHTCAS